MISNKNEKSPQRGEAGADSGKCKTESALLSVSQNNSNINKPPNPNNKTILTEVGGFTPVIDSIKDELGIVSAVIFGVIWRYCQMEDGRCTASQSKIAERAGYSLRTIIRHTNRLVNAGYLKSVTTKGKGVTYFDTGKAQLRAKFSVSVSDTNPIKNPRQKDISKNQQPMTESHNTRDTETHHLCQSVTPPMSESHTKIVLKKDFKDSIKESSIGLESNKFTNQLRNIDDDDSLINLINNICHEVLGYRLKVTSDANELLQTITENDITKSDIKQGIIDYQTNGDSHLRGIGSLTSWIVNAHRKRLNAPKPRTRTYIGPNGEKKEVVIGNGYPYKPRTRIYTYPDGSKEEVIIG